MHEKTQENETIVDYKQLFHDAEVEITGLRQDNAMLVTDRSRLASKLQTARNEIERYKKSWDDAPEWMGTDARTLS